MENIFSPQNTVCNKCCFNIVRRTPIGNEHSCLLNKAYDYTEKGIQAIVTQNGITLKNFLCPYFRTQEWSQKKRDELDYRPVVEIIQEENKMPYRPILLFPKNSTIGPILRKIKRFKTQPEYIDVVLEPNREFDVPNIIKLCDKLKLVYRITVEQVEGGWHSRFANYQSKDFLMLITGYPYINDNWTLDLSVKIQDDLLKFAYAENKKQTITLIHPHVHNSYYFEYTKDWLTELKAQRNAQKYIL